MGGRTSGRGGDATSELVPQALRAEHQNRTVEAAVSERSGDGRQPAVVDIDSLALESREPGRPAGTARKALESREPGRPAGTARKEPKRRKRGRQLERYLFLVLEGERLDAGGLRVAL